MDRSQGWLRRGSALLSLTQNTFAKRSVEFFLLHYIFLLSFSKFLNVGLINVFNSIRERNMRTFNILDTPVLRRWLVYNGKAQKKDKEQRFNMFKIWNKKKKQLDKLFACVLQWTYNWKTWYFWLAEFYWRPHVIQSKTTVRMGEIVSFRSQIH